MPVLTAEEIYECHVKLLSENERLRLVEWTVRDLAQSQNPPSPVEKVDMVSLIGAGRGSFATPEEADAFIRQERDSWGC